MQTDDNRKRPINTALNDLGAEPLAGSGFEYEEPDAQSENTAVDEGEEDKNA